MIAVILAIVLAKKMTRQSNKIHPLLLLVKGRVQIKDLGQLRALGPQPKILEKKSMMKSYLISKI